MRCFVSYCSFVFFLSVLVMVSSAPFLHGSASGSLQIGGGTSNGGTSSSTNLNGLTNVLSQIDLPGLLRGVNSFVKLVGVFCPPLSQVLDNVIQNVTSTAFRVFGRLILQNGGLGGGSSSGGGSGGDDQRVSVVLPTFPPDEDDYDDEDDSSEMPGAASSSATISVRLGEEMTIMTTSPTTTTSTTTASTTTTSTEQSATFPETEVDDDDKESGGTLVEANPATLYTSPTKEESSNVVRRHVRVAREAAEAEEAEDDQEGAESAPQPGEDLANLEDDQDRNKRFLPFGGHVEGHASGGSGNFLFDIIRNTADRAARTVGTVYRMVAGTENFGWGASANQQVAGATGEVAAQSSPAFQLVAGSGATEESDEKANSPGGVVEVDVQKSADYHSGEGIPGPITRLFVIANRGVANLVQDLILRLAQTSERLVNFKARLITSLI